jgi:hypothetical protein
MVSNDETQFSQMQDYKHFWMVISPNELYLDKVAVVIQNIPETNLSSLIKDANEIGNPVVIAKLRPVIEKRQAWLMKVIQKMDKPFSWSMPNAIYSRHDSVQNFLRGNDSSMILSEFNGIKHARNYASKHGSEQNHCSFTMTSDGIGQKAHVVIKKTRSYYTRQQKLLSAFKIELERLSTLTDSKKRKNIDQDEIIVID